ncbi:F-box domain-containing protein [Mycena kentingensis (nom. inval.)]|nr:F-box domain-containing protein [Mycena kentingensis (nom. inval.)]
MSRVPVDTGSLRAQIAALDVEISAQKERLVSLQASRDALDDELRRVTVFPIDTIAPEILSEIFVQCLPEDYLVGRNSVAHAPLLLTRVCKEWARIATGTPELWRNLFLLLNRGRKPEEDVAAVEFLNLWLQNCKGGLRLELLADDEVHPQYSDVLERIAEGAASIRSLECGLYPDAMEELAMHSGPFRLANLVELSLSIKLYYYNESDLVDWGSQSKAFAKMSMLRKVSLRYIPPSSICLPWDQITDFACDTYTAAEVLEVLQLLSNVVRLKVEVSYDEPQGELSTVIHSRLRHLEIQRSDSDEEDLDEQLPMLQFLTLPNLESFKTDSVTEETFSEFLRRSNYPPLAALDFVVAQNETLSDAHANIQLLSGLEHLTALKIDNAGTRMAAELFRALQERPNLLPRLERLDVSIFSWEDTVWERLMRLLLTRQEHPSSPILSESSGSPTPLRWVRITLSELSRWETLVVPKRYQNALRKLKMDGLEVSILSEDLDMFWPIEGE